MAIGRPITLTDNVASKILGVTASTISADAAGGALATTINAKASTGKAIAMSMVFG